ncbi:uncharacterized protein Triagg1_3327 [Trichoderma aggressivum f. europaeum]|uniref:CHAT domain-containing protein n=1 Tax=Trichoderma aggressivum f. europaeum TaxID=173218 RepID=A0AAE1M778_9HYPO|nr:hypothetical protein Triagg1_3327 [Trichoderma aggressivum f. europaeum]
MDAFKSFAAGSEAMKKLKNITLGSMGTLKDIVFNPDARESLETFVLSSGVFEVIKDIMDDPKAMEAFDGAVIEQLDATNSSLPASHQTMLFDDAGTYLYERYNSTKLILHLEKAIQITQRAIEISPLDDEHLPQRLYALITYLVSKYEHTKNLGDLNSIIDITREFINTIMPDHRCYPLGFTLLASLLRYRFSQTADATDIDEAVYLGQDALNAALLKNSSRAENSVSINDSVLIYTQCGKNMKAKYSITKSTRDLEEAIYMFYASAENCYEDNLLLAQCLEDLGTCLVSKGLLTRALPDIDAAIVVLQEAVRITPTDHSSRSKLLCYLAGLHHDKFLITDATTILSDAIYWCREALNNIPLDDPLRDNLVSFLAFFLAERCNRTLAFDDIEESVSLFREIINTAGCSAGQLRRTDFLMRFSKSLFARFQYTGTISDLDESIQNLRDAVSEASCDLETRPLCLANLSSYLHQRYVIFKGISDLEESIRLQREAAECVSLASRYRPGILLSLGARLMTRSKRTHEIGDLNEAIAIFQSNFDTDSMGNSRRAALASLASALDDRYLYSGEIADLTEAILVSREAVRVSSGLSKQMDNSHNLSTYLWRRHESTGQLADLEEAIRVSQNAIDPVMINHPHRAGHLIHLGQLLRHKFARAKAIKSFIMFFVMKKLDLVPDLYCLKTITTCKQYGLYLEPLLSGLNLEQLLNEINIVGSLDITLPSPDEIELELSGAINIEHLLDEKKLDDLLHHLIQERFLARLEGIIDFKLTDVDTMAVIQNARQCFIDALYHEPADVLTRFQAGREAMLSPDFLEEPKAYDIARYTIDFIPLLTSRSLQNSDKQHVLAKVVGTSSRAAAIALHTLSVDRGPIAAVECLETGRGVIGRAVFEQYDLKSLEKYHPDLAHSFLVLRDRYDQSAPRHPVLEINKSIMEAEIEDNRRHRSEKDFTNLLDTIRAKMNFEHFLLPASEIDMLQAATFGPIVILNWSTFRCDALVIGQSGLRSIPLPQLSGDFVSETLTNVHSKDPESLETLSWLWDNAVGPVLDALGFTSTPSDGCWPHIWWIPTGPLIKLPLHAAGHHLRRSGETTLDRVISSYATSVKAIIQSRKRSAPVAAKPLSLVAVAMDKTEGFAPLLHANREVDAVLDILESKADCRRPQQLKTDVMSAIENCQIFHFAGHGRTHPTDPLQSALLLADWQDEPFTVASLLETNLGLNSPFLAYLSACGTGQILNDHAADESIHLVSACQLAGFRHVIGTLWSVDDELCVDMAEMVYKSLCKGFEDESVSWALHGAVRTLRDRWVDALDQRSRSEDRAADGLREGRHAQLDEEEELGRPLWIPYVHYGA